MALSWDKLSHKPSYVHLLYTSHDFEWINLWKLFLDFLVALHVDKNLELLYKFNLHGRIYHLLAIARINLEQFLVISR